jgi:hypothetical protein
MHLDTYKSVQPHLKGRSKPDLVGLRPVLDWLVMEAKGRSHKARASVILKAKNQTQELLDIAGTRPFLRLASVSQFQANRLTLLLEDPPSRQTGVSFNTNPNDFVRDYYEPFVQLIDKGRASTVRVGVRDYRVINLEAVGVEVGLDVEVLRVLEDRTSPAQAAVPRALAGSRHTVGEGSAVQNNLTVKRLTPSQPPTVGTDGVLVILDETWSPAAMRNRQLRS